MTGYISIPAVTAAIASAAGHLEKAPSNQALSPLTYGLPDGADQDQKPKRGGLRADLKSVRSIGVMSTNNPLWELAC